MEVVLEGIIFVLFLIVEVVLDRIYVVMVELWLFWMELKLFSIVGVCSSCF
jgi:hypothetical protein